jgi:hypothetical protein
VIYCTLNLIPVQLKIAGRRSSRKECAMSLDLRPHRLNVGIPTLDFKSGGCSALRFQDAYVPSVVWWVSALAWLSCGPVNEAPSSAESSSWKGPTARCPPVVGDHFSSSCGLDRICFPLADRPRLVRPAPILGAINNLQSDPAKFPVATPFKTRPVYRRPRCVASERAHTSWRRVHAVSIRS